MAKNDSACTDHSRLLSSTLQAPSLLRTMVPYGLGRRLARLWRSRALQHTSTRRITGRLTLDMGAGYTQATGVDTYNDDYYVDHGLLVTSLNIDPSRCQTETFAYGQRYCGIIVDA